MEHYDALTPPSTPTTTGHLLTQLKRTAVAVAMSENSVVGSQTAVSKANYGHLKMLDKIRQIPLKVVLSALFLLATLVAVVILHPPFALALLGVALGIYSMVTVLNYWIGRQ